jgi:hypothetical protein
LPAHRRFLSFSFIKGSAYEYLAVPLLALPPWTFSKGVEVALASLRIRGLRASAYVDDYLLFSLTQEHAV